MLPDSFGQSNSQSATHETLETTAPEAETGTDATESAQDLEYVESLRSIHSFAEKEDTPDPGRALFTPKRLTEPPIADEKVKELLSNGQAETLLNIYRSMCITFPFVPVEKEVTANQLSTAKPMLLLAILTVAAWDDHRLQRHLDRVYRRELANNTFIHPRKTISLLQSVLVYLSRYQNTLLH